ncbi:hypothetical protein A2V56_04790 [Candidatus Woesebacteria bacterium RBG_19FT_COMBO_42_9]|uniref:Pyridoxamine 5'-phosphate oxidase N-terminal domain-containing protein n=1 Tax=Candidatus Woesebacteria bacterium RBG_16_42_24 TaxID=1802485 RepID=A0A1F7XLN7_9BACT|nr:MAG: hypothetical protein A2V97_04025 [Candidatus Woesebacteria bacterium RBG_16_42_24]OGM17715.1 MAG: hypothetical protein A2V56_04790 [Candidatus Woesebacteria bacterium RBG_19FT_COMBO_42_9]OGM66543.1 MAG: hypothetical protein A2985_03060 [Candidatus Woesebacteria bacterium RIFCSPLOWO2_01_FULL_43_11]
MTDIDALTNKSKKVIDTIEYIDLATITEDGKPWNSPLWFVRDDKYNLYFYSPKYTQHSENIRNNGNGFVVIYDSRAPEGTGFGVYMTVEVKELNTVSEVDEALKWVYKKKKKKRTPQEFLGNSPRRIYKVTPKEAWVNDAELKNGFYLDYRIPIKLT